MARRRRSFVPRSLVRATDIDVLPLDRVVERREGYLMVRSPSNPEHYWGNLLVFDAPPGAGDGVRWEDLFRVEFAGDPEVRHRTFAWEGTDGALGRAREEFLVRGYELEQVVGLVARPENLRPHPRENRTVRVSALDSEPGADEELWEQVVELQAASRPATVPEDEYRAFARRRLHELRRLFAAGRGSWYVALEPERDEVVASCGVVVTGERGRFQAVDTAEAHRRRGICSRLVVEAGHLAAERHGARQLVIAADPDYHALGLYESLGFEPRECSCGVCRHPPRVE